MSTKQAKFCDDKTVNELCENLRQLFRGYLSHETQFANWYCDKVRCGAFDDKIRFPETDWRKLVVYTLLNELSQGFSLALHVGNLPLTNEQQLRIWNIYNQAETDKQAVNNRFNAVRALIGKFVRLIEYDDVPSEVQYQCRIIRNQSITVCDIVSHGDNETMITYTSQRGMQSGVIRLGYGWDIITIGKGDNAETCLTNKREYKDMTIIK